MVERVGGGGADLSRLARLTVVETFLGGGGQGQGELPGFFWRVFSGFFWKSWAEVAISVPGPENCAPRGSEGLPWQSPPPSRGVWPR